ncbi:hypothetical protein O6H91_Y504500 [Diphasiastrum complanatum]|nr:hypothetical protein O6H91_Y504500 [Diphasiastrum complanatum]
MEPDNIFSNRSSLLINNRAGAGAGAGAEAAAIGAEEVDRNETLDRRGSYKPLTIFRAIRGITCLSILLSTALMMLIYLSPLTFVLVRFFSLRYSRRLVAFFFGRWLSMWPFLFEKINGTKVVFAGDRVPDSERVLLICNHRTEVDWMYLWNLALRKSRIGYVKYVVKSSVRNAPIFGWAFYVVEFLLLDRKWELDEPIIKSYLSSFQDKRDPLWLIIFPEGTDFTEQKMLKGQQFAEIRGLPKLENVLMPRTRGFIACLSQLHSSLDAVYDLTIGYNYCCPRFIDNLFGIDPAEVHIHVRRIPINDIPTSEDALSGWLYEAFLKKDKLLTYFKRHSHFQSSGIEKSWIQLVAYQILFSLFFVLFLC